MLEQSAPEGQYFMERTLTRAVSEELQAREKTHAGNVHEDLSPVEGIPCWSSGIV